jgi:predicted nucleic acid-binding Zn ribbon protein
MNKDKTCNSCGKPIQGRADKKFCDDYCRNNFNNSINGETNSYVKKVIGILKKNRKILEESIPANVDFIRINLDKLIQRGFQTKYFTHSYTNKKGDIYLFCFEYGYLLLDGNSVLVVKRKE